jgi:hypothetical protein
VFLPRGAKEAAVKAVRTSSWHAVQKKPKASGKAAAAAEEKAPIARKHPEGSTARCAVPRSRTARLPYGPMQMHCAALPGGARNAERQPQRQPRRSQTQQRCTAGEVQLSSRSVDLQSEAARPAIQPANTPNRPAGRSAAQPGSKSDDPASQSCRRVIWPANRAVQSLSLRPSCANQARAGRSAGEALHEVADSARRDEHRGVERGAGAHAGGAAKSLAADVAGGDLGHLLAGAHHQLQPPRDLRAREGTEPPLVLHCSALRVAWGAAAIAGCCSVPWMVHCTLRWQLLHAALCGCLGCMRGVDLDGKNVGGAFGWEECERG